MNKFKYVDAPAGSGKTYSLTHFAVEQANQHRKIIIAQPTKELIRQTLKGIAEIDPGVKVTAIFGERGTKNVVGAITRHLTDAAPLSGEVLLITHEGLERCQSASKRDPLSACNRDPLVRFSIPGDERTACEGWGVGRA